MGNKKLHYSSFSSMSNSGVFRTYSKLPVSLACNERLRLKCGMRLCGRLPLVALFVDVDCKNGYRVSFM